VVREKKQMDDGRWDVKVTKRGEDFYRGHQESYTALIPAIVYNTNMSGVVTATRRDVPLDPHHQNGLENRVVLPSTLPATLSQREKDERCRRVLQEWIATLDTYTGTPPDETTPRPLPLLPLYDRPSRKFVVDDTRPIRIFTEVQGLARNTSEQQFDYRDRPLQGVVIVPPTLLDLQDLHPDAYVYDKDCILRQLLLLEARSNHQPVPVFTQASRPPSTSFSRRSTETTTPRPTPTSTRAGGNEASRRA
jgi:hypothetical protein